MKEDRDSFPVGFGKDSRKLFHFKVTSRNFEENLVWSIVRILGTFSPPTLPIVCLAYVHACVRSCVHEQVQTPPSSPSPPPLPLLLFHLSHLSQYSLLFSSFFFERGSNPVIYTTMAIIFSFNKPFFQRFHSITTLFSKKFFNGDHH